MICTYLYFFRRSLVWKRGEKAFGQKALFESCHRRKDEKGFLVERRNTTGDEQLLVLRHERGMGKSKEKTSG